MSFIFILLVFIYMGCTKNGLISNADVTLNIITDDYKLKGSTGAAHHIPEMKDEILIQLGPRNGNCGILGY